MANEILIDVDEALPEYKWLPLAEKFADDVLKECGWEDEEVSILFCNDNTIAELNKNYRNIEGPTDVLSFESGETYTAEDGNEYFVAGSIAISTETLPKNAEYFEVSMNEELKRLLVHGLLHLNGYDHGEEHVEKGVEPVCEMLVLQKELMEKFQNVVLLENDKL